MLEFKQVNINCPAQKYKKQDNASSNIVSPLLKKKNYLGDMIDGGLHPP